MLQLNHNDASSSISIPMPGFRHNCKQFDYSSYRTNDRNQPHSSVN